MARAFDLIEREYGWSDDQVLSLTLRRVRQIQSAIFQRKYIEAKTRRSELSWQTRNLAQIIAYANTETSKTGENKLAEIAAKLDMDNPGSTTDKASSNGDGASPPQQAEPSKGSFERLMGLMGPGMR